MAAKMILIDGADRLAAYIERRTRAEVERRNAAAKRARILGDLEEADDLDAEWLAMDQLTGLVSCWTQDFLKKHRRDVLASLIESWPKLPSDDDDPDDDDEELDIVDYDDSDDEIAEAAD